MALFEDMAKDSRIRFVQEPAGLETTWKKLAQEAPPSMWTDTYLMAFAQAADLAIVTFDRGFERFGDPRTEILTG